ncbi:MBL fold metallo-hydrolase [Undibacterium sp. 14-3-2]|uniref:MBL fold metallo-hydrolase n=1 Tax=Undibacterium sp. 14-3-2 TaxID=2800129 RepID=UPI0019080FF9|nr:MBL fold metallo-hydrolase [Undibacterium sp. 14-3-2]MBK1890489.1 MBL fold metallo-hydrolase [Undibacterium sp. 14-3-2]
MKLLPFVAALSAALSLQAPSAYAEAPKSTTAASGVYRMQLGEFEVSTLSDGTVTIPIDKLLTNIKPAVLAESLKQADLAPMMETSINTFLINTGSKLILVDTGAGDSFKAPIVAKAGRLQQSLKNAGYKAEQVDIVLLTHIHGDHSGGLSLDGQRLFPNADIYVDEHDAKFWLDRSNEANAAPGQRHGFAEAEAMLGPYVKAGRLKTFNGAAQITTGVRSRPAYGHTPGHSYYEVESGGQKLLLIGDMIHATATQMAHPETTIVFDVDAMKAREQRTAFLPEVVKQGYWIGTAHISFPGLGHIHHAGKGAYRWQPANYSAW